MKKNEHKARAHLTRAQQLLQAKYVDALGFGTLENLKDLPRENLEMIMRRLNLEEVSRATRVDRTFAEIGNDITGKILMKHHKYWKQNVRVECKKCISSLLMLCGQRLNEVVTEGLYTITLRDVFKIFFATCSTPRSRYR